MQINFCSPQFFFNTSQKFPFVVYDLREHQNGYLKNSIHVTHVHETETIDSVKKYLNYPEQNSEAQKLQQLFNSRKRNFNFFVPFDTSDMFSLIIRDRVRGSDSEAQDQFSVPVDTVKKWWTEIRQMCPYRKQHKMRSRAQTMVIRDEEDLDDIIEEETQNMLFLSARKKSIASSKKVIELQEITLSSGPKIKRRSASQPKSQKNFEGSLHINSEIFEETLRVYETFARDKVRQLFIILDPIQIIFANYPFLNYEITKNRGFLDKTFPNEIIEKKLYLGGAEHARDVEMLTEILGITHVVNATIEVKNYSDQLKYLNIQILDEPQSQIKLHFDIAYDFIENAFKEGGKVFVHCAQGKSRSACIVVMYLMKKYGWTFDKSYEFVKECREVVCMNDGFINQLLELK